MHRYQFVAAFYCRTLRDTAPIRHYTVQDAFMGLACQGQVTEYSPDNDVSARIRTSARRYMDPVAWDEAFASAYHKMASAFANFVNRSVCVATACWLP